MFDRLPDEPPGPRRDRKVRCPRCETALTADMIRCPQCDTPHPQATAIYHMRRNRRLERERRQAINDAAAAARAKKGK